VAEENRIKVLVADDGHDNREFLVEYVLNPGGFLPLVARDGIEAMELVRQYHPDLILLDLQMPRMNGMQLLDALQEEGWDIPVILMTFLGSDEIGIEVFRKGVRDYVKKPNTDEEMEEAMKRCLGEVRLRREKDALTERLLQGNATLNRRIKELNTLYQIGKQVTSLAGMDVLLPRVVEAAVQVVRAEQSSVMLLEGGQLITRAVKLADDPQARSVHEPSADKLARRAALSGHTVLLGPEDLARHRAQNPLLPAGVVYVPLKVSDRVLGVLSAEHLSEDAEPFTKQDGAMLSALGDYAAIAIENARIYAQLHEMSRQSNNAIRAAFERYVAPSVVDRVLQNPGALRLGGERREISVVFADMHGFTAFSEQISPEEVVGLLNTYFKLAVDVIFSREGTLDKFQGDAVMALFNAPEDQPDHPYRAVDAAVALQRAIDEHHARSGGSAPLFGIGVHMGEAVVGNIGASFAMNYTAIGDAVNVAKRLQEHAAPGQILVSGAVIERLGDALEVAPLGAVDIRGRQQSIEVYELRGLR